MEGHVSPGEYKDVVLFLATAGVIVPLFRRWRISPILGFLGAGVVLGPFGLGAFSGAFPWVGYFTIDNPDEVAQLAEFGVVFLLFMIGLELSWERLRLMRRLVFGMGALQVGLCVAAIAGVAIALGVDPVAAAAIGAALALSSTAVVMPILTEQKRQHSTAGRATFSVLLFQDLAVAPILITLAILGRGGGDEAFSPKLLLAFAPAVLGILGLVAFGRLLLRPMMKSVARAKSEELFMAASLLVVIGAGLVSALTGLSMALGAFIAGLLLAETEYRREVEVTIEPFKGLLLGLFFLSVGIGLDLSILAAKPMLVLGMAVGLIALNASVVFGLARLFGLRSPPAIEAGLLLAGGGEFAFVILSAAMGDGIVDRAIGQTVLVASTLSMMCIPMLAALGLKLGGRKVQGEDLSPEPAPVSDGDKPQVLVVGYGRV
uniref:cation:proton antiporter domain-containing protein n=1 Tax=Phenylobacterium sp. TaxID=1871053 RepID=UPI0030F3E2BB